MKRKVLIVFSGMLIVLAAFATYGSMQVRATPGEVLKRPLPPDEHGVPSFRTHHVCAFFNSEKKSSRC
jgi:hypothetical protein